MPKIKTYAGKGKLIPIRDAAIIDAYECPWTGKMYRRKEEYVRHLNELREYTFHPRIRARNATKIKEQLWALDSFEAIIKWLTDNSLFMFEQCARPNWMDAKETVDAKKNFKFEITYLNLRYSERVSNSHDCPVGGVTNWRGDELFKDGTPKPKGYPGWEGRIEFKKSHDTGFSSDLLEPLRIHTGTGGGRGIKHSAGYEVKFFKQDWPGLAAVVDREYEIYSKNVVMERLKDNFVTPFRFDVNYGEASYFRH